MALSGKQRRALRAHGHHLNPIVLIGKDGIDDGVVSAAEQALLDHELIKVKVGEGAPLDRHEVAEALAERTGSEVAQVLGRTILLFRRNPENPKIDVPGLPMPEKPRPDEKAAPKQARKAAKKATGKSAPVRKTAAKKTAAKKTARKSAVKKGTSARTTRRVVRRSR